MSRTSAVALKWMTTTISCAVVFISLWVDHSGVGLNDGVEEMNFELMQC